MAYAFPPGLSNRPARGTFVACSGARDCCGQVQCEACGGLVAEGQVGPRSVVLGDPGRDQIAGMGKVAKQRLVEKLIPHPAVEAFDKAVLLRLYRRAVVPFDLALGALLQDRV